VGEGKETQFATKAHCSRLEKACVKETNVKHYLIRF